MKMCNRGICKKQGFRSACASVQTKEDFPVYPCSVECMSIASDNRGSQIIISYFSTKIHVVDTH